MTKTRLLMLVGVLLLSLALVGIAVAADTPKSPPTANAPVAFTGAAPSTIENVLDSGVTAIDPILVPSSGDTFDLCFTVLADTNDAEYMDGFDVDLPDEWTVNQVIDVPGTGCGLGHIFGVDAGNVIFWYTNGMPSGCGDWTPGTYNFCANVTVNSCTTSFNLDWNYWGDTWGSPPHSASGTETLLCALPGIQLIPADQEASGCNGVPQVHTLSLFNNSGEDGVFDMDYAVDPAGMGILEGPATVAVLNGETVDFEVTLTPDVCTFDPIVGTVFAAGNGFETSATIHKTIADVPSWKTVADSAPNWAGNGYPRDGCTAMNADGDWVVYELGDTSGTGPFGFWGYNTATNTWALVGATGTPADRWAPDWAYDPETNLCYVTGGATLPGGGNLTATYVFDPVANAFTPLGSFTSARDFHTSWIGTIDEVKYLCLGGGVNSGGIMIQATQCYDLSQAAPGVWNAENAQIAMLPTDPFGAADGVLHAETGDQFWYVGGAIQAGFALSDEAWFWDTADSAWHSAGHTGIPVYRVEGDFFNGDFYQIGGSLGGFSPTTDVVRGRFNGTDWQFETIESLHNARMDNVVAITPDSVWSVDGYDGGVGPSDYVERLEFCPECVGFAYMKVVAPPLEMTLQSGMSDTITFTIEATGTTNLVWAAEADATWFSLAPMDGVLPPGTSQVVTTTFDAAGLFQGQFTTTLDITSNDPITPVVTLPVTLNVQNIADLNLAKVASADEVRVGQLLTYTLTVSNTGPMTATGVVVDDILPPEVAFVDSLGCTEVVTGEVSCEVGDLGVMTEAEVQITVMAVSDGDATNTANVTTTSFDPDLENNMAEVVTVILPEKFYFFLPILQRIP